MHGPGIAPAPQSAVAAAESALLENRTGYAAMHDRLIALRSELSQLVDRMDRSYWIGRVELLLGFHQFFAEQRSSAIEHFKRARHFAIDALEQREFSDGYRVLADAYGELLLLRGIPFQFLNGKRARDAALQALELDFGNVRAHVSAAGYYMNAPSFAGGDIEYAIEILEQVGGSDNITRIEHFLICGFLAYSYHEAGTDELAQEFFERAYSLYPDSAWLAQIQRHIEPR